MPENLIGSRQMPPFDIMSMILEGPKGYFGRRGTLSDQLWVADQEQQNRGKFAQGLLGSGAYNAAMDNPLDRRAQMGLWAAMQGGPASIADTGNTLLGQALGAGYQHNQTAFEDQLAKQRIILGTDEALRQKQGELDIANRNLQAQLGMVFGPQGDGAPMVDQQRRDAAYDIAAHNLGLQARPEGMSVGQTQDGRFAYVPTLGSENWRKSQDELSPINEISGSVTKLQQMSEQGIGAGQAQSLIATIQSQMRQLDKMGTLDEGTQQLMGKIIKDYGRYTGTGLKPGDYAYFNEQLVALQKRMAGKYKDWETKWLMQPGANPYAPGSITLPPAPKSSADTAIPAAKPSGTVGAGGKTNDFSIYNQPADPNATTPKQRQETYKKTLKEKFPGAKF